MRIQAFILLFPFAVFMAETASFVPAMKDACTMVSQKKSSCCMKKKEAAVCHAKKDTDQKKPGSKCTGDPDCTACPLCYTFILQQQYEWASMPMLFKKNYGSPGSNYIFSYTASAWKPPNGSFCFS